MDGRPAIDEPTIRRMLEDLGDEGLEIFDQLIAIFTSDTALLLSELKDAAARSDFDEAARKAHRIKGGSAQIGALTLRADSEMAETSAHSGDSACLQAAVDRMTNHWPHVVAELAAVKDRIRSGTSVEAGGAIV